MKVGERIRLRRKETGMSADQLADIIGVSRSTIFRYENGAIEKMPTSVLEPIAKALNTTPEYLIGWADIARITQDSNGDTVIDPIYKKDERKLLREFQKLNDLGRTKAIERITEIAEISRYTKPADELTEEDFPEYNYLEPIAAHNDNATDEEQIKLMQKDIERIKGMRKK